MNKLGIATPAALALISLLFPPPAAGRDGEAQNKLAGEKSPYLLQHADNPVDWYPWGEEAFARAKKENKPIFLSIGYSTCHWCHVMEHESFEDPETAAFLNEHFVSIKLDREERPDLDRIFMNYQQATRGGGGWPLNLWLTPEQRVPFFSGTYFPREPRPGGGPTFMDLLGRIETAWREHGTEIAADSEKVLAELERVFAAPPAELPDAVDPALIEKTFADLVGNFDPDYGGFGPQPKFPQPALYRFLFDYGATIGTGDEEAEEKKNAVRTMVATSLEKMARGGIFDHLGGGFHRYAVDSYWHVPHFEKMLYDQAQLAGVYLNAWQLTGNPLFRDIALAIFEYVERDLSHPDGGFYSAENADSPVPGAPEGAEEKEGAFYLWSTDEIEALLGAEDAALFNAAYDVKAEGNAPPGSDPFGEFMKKNILYRKKSDADLAKTFDRDEAAVRDSLAAAREKLLTARAERPRPSLDDKIITSWNGLMISAYARAYEVLGEARFLDRAQRAAGFLLEHLYDEENKRLLRTWRDGPADIAAFTDDYAMLIQALLDLYEASLDPVWLIHAVRLQDEHLARFYDEENGGFFDAGTTSDDLILALKDAHDGARPSGNAVAALNLLRLSSVLKTERYADAFDKTTRLFAEDIERSPSGHTTLAIAVLRAHETPAQIVIAGAPEDPATRAIVALVRERMHPNKSILLLDGGAGQELLAQMNPLLANFRPIDGKPAFFLCRDFVCLAPATDLKEIAAQLDQL